VLRQGSDEEAPSLLDSEDDDASRDHEHVEEEENEAEADSEEDIDSDWGGIDVENAELLPTNPTSTAADAGSALGKCHTSGLYTKIDGA
jgi:hypothetical protein